MKRSRSRKKDDAVAELLVAALVIGGIWWNRNIGNVAGFVVVALALAATVVGIRLALNHQTRRQLMASGLHQVDQMSGEEFEDFIAAHFRRLNFRVTTTPATADYGADLIL